MSDIQKTIQTLRDFNLWRKGDEAMEQPDPCGIGEAIDEAIEAMEKLGRLTDAALAVVDRWETPYWKQVEHTGVYIAALRKAVEEVKGGPHCGSDKDPFFSRIEPMGDYCPDCGKERA